jgi:ADP-ribose pyrophosphatase YjhB (NUDIX family)
MPAFTPREILAAGTYQVELRCSAVLFRDSRILLVRRSGARNPGWVLPGGTPRHGESMAACVRREVREETGLHAEPSGVAFVLEAAEPGPGGHTVDLVFLAAEHGRKAPPLSSEPGLEPQFVALDALSALDLRPPLAGHLRGLAGRRFPVASYLGNLWRPQAGSQQQEACTP